MSTASTQIQFEHAGSQLTAVRIVRGTRSPLIASLHRALLALGIVVAGYEVRAGDMEVAERIVLERQDGEAIEADLREATKHVIFRVVDQA